MSRENEDYKPHYCLMIDSLEAERFTWKTGNYYANEIIPKLVIASGIDATCPKGYYGYMYKDDSSFNSDISKWREYFNCNK